MTPTGPRDSSKAASEDHPTELPATQQVGATPLQCFACRSVALTMNHALARKCKESLIVGYALIQSV